MGENDNTKSQTDEFEVIHERLNALTDGLRRESDERKADVRQLRTEVSDKFLNIQEQLGQLALNLGNLGGAVQNIKGQLDVWNDSQSARDKLTEAIAKSNEQNSRDINLTVSAVASHSEQLKGLRSDISGDEGDKPSLFSMLADIRKEMAVRFTVQENLVGQAISSSRANSARIDSLSLIVAEGEKREQAVRAKWDARKQAVLGVVKSAVGSRYLNAMGLALAGAVVIRIAPELTEIIQQIMLSMIQ